MQRDALLQSPSGLSLSLEAAAMAAVPLPDTVDGEGRIERPGKSKGPSDPPIATSVPWGMRFLVARVDAMLEVTAEQRRQLRSWKRDRIAQSGTIRGVPGKVNCTRHWMQC